MTNTLDIQQHLAALGYNPGPIDGKPGRLTTAAVRAFQMAHPSLVDDGIVGPLTLAALNASEPTAPQLDDDITPPWIENLRQYIGLQEVRDNKKLRDYLDSDGSTVGDPAKIPWCGDAIQTPLALTLPEEPLPANPYWALNWANWGVGVGDIVPLGAVATKYRNGGGHVFFVVGHDATHYHALGGNQSNSICIILEPKADCNPLRWPSTYPLPKTGMAETTIEASINASEA